MVGNMRWIRTSELSASGRILQQCLLCGRKSTNPEKHCPAPCASADPSEPRENRHPCARCGMRFTPDKLSYIRTYGIVCAECEEEHTGISREERQRRNFERRSPRG
jgi:hypothetical protein